MSLGISRQPTASGALRSEVTVGWIHLSLVASHETGNGEPCFGKPSWFMFTLLHGESWLRMVMNGGDFGGWY